MSHLSHIINNKHILELRFVITRLIREFFWSEGFLEVETPLILRLPGQEPYLSPLPINIHNENGKEFAGYLHTSPEYTMKKMLAGGFEKIFSLGKCFRDHESFGGTHNPEFTMIEWYRAEENMFKLMEDCEKLIEYIRLKINLSGAALAKTEIQNPGYRLQDTGYRFERFSMKELWDKYAQVNLDDYLTIETMFELCKQKGYNTQTYEKYEDLFFRIFLNEIEPKLADLGAVFVYNYPAQLAALSKLSPEDNHYAERFELYVNGLELANAFSELTDSTEQRKRLVEERELRQKLGKSVYGLDEEFLSALESMPPSAGIALGVDRLIMLLLGCKNINNVLILPASGLFCQE